MESPVVAPNPAVPLKKTKKKTSTEAVIHLPSQRTRAEHQQGVGCSRSRIVIQLVLHPSQRRYPHWCGESSVLFLG